MKRRVLVVCAVFLDLRLQNDLVERNYNIPSIKHRKTTVHGFDLLYPLVLPASHQSVLVTQIREINYLGLVSY